ncbi:MAG: signal peptidase II [Spirochaetia bacterium]|nr:signal peptidase II [Spirochaetota bacterium]MDW8112805.1 signal peptidase II [Spirochaetia bacterium]
MKELIARLRLSLKSVLEFAIANRITASIIVVVVVVDQITKYLARTFLEYGKPVNIIGDLLRFTLVYNRGVSFGLFDASEANVIHAILPFVVIVIILFLIYIYVSISKELEISLMPLAKVSFGLIWGGAFGNLIDRIIFSYVTDFVDFGIGNVWRFYIFNVADSCITIGTLIIIFTMIYSDILKNRKVESDGYGGEKDI